jgi:hypothetical protein
MQGPPFRLTREESLVKIFCRHQKRGDSHVDKNGLSGWAGFTNLPILPGLTCGDRHRKSKQLWRLSEKGGYHSCKSCEKEEESGGDN